LISSTVGARRRPDDGGFEFGDAGGDLPLGGGGDVVGFEVEYLALQPAVEFGDLGGRFAQAGGDGRAAAVFLVGGGGGDRSAAQR
jgi:hypothetical protein